MPQAYSDPRRESDPYSLPNIETFYMDASDIAEARWTDGDGEPMEEGWYWWACFPGCMPDGEPSGPFATEAEALADAREGIDLDDETGD